MISRALPDAGEVAGRLRPAVARLHRVLRQQSDVGLTPTKLAHLATVGRDGPLTLGELAALERVAPPTVTKVVQDLEARGLVQRDVDPADRRVARVRITDEGAHQLDEVRHRKDLWLAQRIAALPADEAVRLADALDVLEHLASWP